MQTDWEKRAHELAPVGWNDIAEQTWVRLAIQLGREMAAEARTEEAVRWAEHLKLALPACADARAEEIAQEIELRKTPWSALLQGETLICAGIARSTISRPVMTITEAMMLYEAEHARRYRCYPIVDGFPLIRPLTNTGSRPLTPQECRAWGQEEGARVEWDETGFEIIGANKKTREQVLESALREIVNRAGPYEDWSESPSEIAERALEWKPPS